MPHKKEQGDNQGSFVKKGRKGSFFLYWNIIEENYKEFCSVAAEKETSM